MLVFFVRIKSKIKIVFLYIKKYTTEEENTFALNATHSKLERHGKNTAFLFSVVVKYGKSGEIFIFLLKIEKNKRKFANENCCENRISKKEEERKF